MKGIVMKPYVKKGDEAQDDAPVAEQVVEAAAAPICIA